MSWGLDKLLFLKQRGFLLLQITSGSIAFSPAAFPKNARVSLVFDIFPPLASLFFSARPFSGSALKKQPVSLIFQISASSYPLVNSTSLSIQTLTVYSSTSPASPFTVLSRTPYEIFHFSGQPLEAVKFLNSTLSKHYFISIASSFNIGPSRSIFAAQHF